MAKRARNPDVPEVRTAQFAFGLGCELKHRSNQSVSVLQISAATREAFKSELAEKVWPTGCCSWPNLSVKTLPYI